MNFKPTQYGWGIIYETITTAMLWFFTIGGFALSIFYKDNQYILSQLIFTVTFITGGLTFYWSLTMFFGGSSLYDRRKDTFFETTHLLVRNDHHSICRRGGYDHHYTTKNEDEVTCEKCLKLIRENTPRYGDCNCSKPLKCQNIHSHNEQCPRDTICNRPKQHIEECHYDPTEQGAEHKGEKEVE